VAEAVEAYTMGSAYAEFQENVKGSIAPGKLADMVMLSDDIFSVDPAKIRDMKVLKTIVGGKVVWDEDRKNSIRQQTKFRREPDPRWSHVSGSL
jgi:predicted amidohydrolase YtcJ